MTLTPQDQQDIVAAHNVYRSDPAINTPALQWSSDLAPGAQSWADHLASTSTFEHSGTPGVGENIAQGSTGNFTPVSPPSSSFRLLRVSSLRNSWASRATKSFLICR